MFKHKIYQFFLLEFFKIFALVTISLSLLIWITQASRLLELITEYGNSTEIYLKYITLNYPKILTKTFLLNFLISLFFLFSKLENAKELNIMWLSGINKIKIYKITLIIGLICLIFNLLLSNLITPWSSFKGRMILKDSKFTLINSLVKEANFNSPLKNLTIYVNENDQKGNLKGIFIYEKNRTIIAKNGKVLKDKNGSYLQLLNGTTQEKSNNKINFINFDSTIFDFSKYETKNIGSPKFNERELSWLINNLNRKTNNNLSNLRLEEIREEINTRILVPLFIFIICNLSSFLLFNNNEKITPQKLKILVYSFAFFLLIINQILVGISGKSIYHSFLYLLILVIFFFISNSFFIKLIKNEAK